MHRFYVPDAESQQPIMALRGSESRHALSVLRLRVGDSLLVLDGAGHEYLCRALRCERENVTVSVIERKEAPPPRHRLTLLQGVTKHKSMDVVIQKATELGVRRIVPVLCERSVVKIHAQEADVKMSGWQSTAIAAMKQSGAAWLPMIDRPAPLAVVVAGLPNYDLSFVASLRADSVHPRVSFLSYRAQRAHAPADVAVWVGPEGDFSPGELETIQRSGAIPITLGPLVLRSETAACYCLSVLNYELRSPEWSLSEEQSGKGPGS